MLNDEKIDIILKADQTRPYELFHKKFKRKNSKNLKRDDIVYVYVAAPYSAIMYKCIVIDDIDIKVKVLDRYDKDKYNFKLLNKYGVTSIRGPRHITESLSRYINQIKKN